MRLWTLWLCAVLLIGSAAASDVPFVFDEETTGVANYTSNQFEEASTSSINLIGVPFSSTPQNDETLEFPVTGGGNSPSRTTEKKVEDLKNVLDSKVEPDNPAVIDEVGLAAGKYSGDRTIEQISAIYDYLKEGWHYLGDPRGFDYFKNASESLNLGKKNDCVGVGDCDDFAILMAGLVESIGGTTRIILARNNTTGGHAYAEVYLGQINASNSQVEDIISWLKKEYETDKIYTHIDTDTKDVWLNLDWGPDERGNAHPGGPFYPGDKHYIICIRDTYGKTPLKLPEKANKPPVLIGLVSDKSDPQESGATITWTASARDPDKDQISYRFFVNDEPKTSWGSDNEWVWQTTDDDIGQNQIEVRVRDGKHRGPNRFDDNRITGFNITEPNHAQVNEKQSPEPSHDEVTINDSRISTASANNVLSVPFIFNETQANIVSYTPAELELAYTSSPDLVGVPTVVQADDNESIEVPVTGGDNSPIDTTEKNVADLKKIFDERVDKDNSDIHSTALILAAKYPGDFTIDQISAIYEYLKNGDGTKSGWCYVSDPRDEDIYHYASESLKMGDDADCSGVGDCDDFAILMAALVESIGGTTRIILARNNTTGGHAYAEVYLGNLSDQNNQIEGIIGWLKQKYNTDKIYTHIDTDTKNIWLNLEWGASSEYAYPGGPFYPGDKHYIICIRDAYGRIPLKLPEKANKLPALISLVPDKSDPQESGASITWTANAKDPDKDQISYRFFVNYEPETSWSDDNTWTWQTTDDIGQNQIEVRVRDEKHAGPNEFDDRRIIRFNITEPIIVEAPSNVTSNESVWPLMVTENVTSNVTEISTDSANTVPSAGTSIVFPDSNLETAIRNAINKPEGAIYASDLEGLISLNDSGGDYKKSESDIKDITGLEYCTNLKEINLSYNQITDVSPLAGLTNLQDLELGANQITDVSPLAGLTNLQDLELGANQITDASPLAGLNNLQTLNLFDNQITDVSPLAGLNNLQTLNLGWNQITDVTPLTRLSNLQTLGLGLNQITDLSPLAGLNNLQDLGLSNNQITDVTPLAGLINLQILNLGYNQITDVSSLAGLNDLQYLDLSSNQITDVSSLAGLNNLQYLYLSYNQITDITPLAGLTGCSISY